MPNGQIWTYTPYGTISNTGEMINASKDFNNSIVSGYGGTLIV
jgi:hypothetical protein